MLKNMPLLFLVILKSLFSPAFADDRLEWSGQVSDAVTGKPLAGARVYLSNTTLGTITDAEGRYVLDGILPGAWELAVTCTGYASQSRPVQARVGGPTQQDFRLDVLTGAEESGTAAAKPEDWPDQLQRFIEYFLGSDDNIAGQCRILNPELLDFRYDDATQMLQATTGNHFITLENQWLGYKIDIQLKQFRYRSYGNGTQLFTTKFSELVPQNAEQRRIWIQNRLAAYYGSVRHFLKALIHDRLAEEGFTLWDIAPAAGGAKDPVRMDDHGLAREDRAAHDWVVAIKTRCRINYEPNKIARRQLKGCDPHLLTIKLNPFFVIMQGADSVRINSLGIVSEPLKFAVLNNWSYLSFAYRLPYDYEPDAAAVLQDEQHARQERSLPIGGDLQPIMDRLLECDVRFDNYEFLNRNRDRLDAIRDYCEKLLEQNPQDALLHYLIGICSRETGLSAPSVARIRTWPSADKHFKRAIELDSALKDVYYQRAVLQRYRDDYWGAVASAATQIAKNRDAWSAQIGIGKLYDVLLNHESFSELSSRLSAGTQSYDRYFLGELYRRQENYEMADSIFTAILKNPGSLPVQPVLLSRVRLLVQTDKPREAAATYWQAVASITDAVSAQFLLEDFYPIISQAEYGVLALELDPQTVQLALQQFWQNRDPAPAAAYNRRLLEHYQRLVYAEKTFRYDGLRHRTQRDLDALKIQYPAWFANNDRFCDRGMIYLRFGKPDEEMRKNITDEAVMATEGKNTVSWLYRQSDVAPQMIFHFVNHANMPNNYYVLTSGFRDKAIIADLVGWDPAFTRLQQSNDESYLEDLQQRRLQELDFSFRHDRRSRPERSRTLPLAHEMNIFHESDIQDVLQLAYSLPLQDAAALLTPGDSLVEVGLALMDERQNLVYRDLRTVNLNDRSQWQRFHGNAIGEFEVPLQRRDYLVRLHAQSSDGHCVYYWQNVFSCKDSLKNRLSCSPLKQAYNIEPIVSMASRFRKDIAMVPNPRKIYHAYDPLFVYYEIYNLTLGANGRTDYVIDFSVNQKHKKKNLLDKMTDIFKEGKKSQVATQYGRAGRKMNESNYYFLDIKDLSVGDYELVLNIKDNRSGESALARTEFAIID